MHRVLATCRLWRPSSLTLTLTRQPFCSSATDHVVRNNEHDDVEFGVLDSKFLDSRSLKQLKDTIGTPARSTFEPKSALTTPINVKTDVKIEPRGQIATVNSSDEFGSLSTNAEFQKRHHDVVRDEDFESDGSEGQHIRLSKYNRKHSQPWYDHRLTKLSKQGKVIEAVDLLHEMIDKDRVMPSKVSYTVVISALAKAGYTSLAFKLFYQMRERGIKAPRHVFSALFNACANCSDKQKGLHQAHYLRDYMTRKDSPRHYISYKAQIKAFAFTGDMITAFATLDEALESGHTLDVEACSMLMMACVSDKENGFLHAIKVWRLMLEHGLRPDLPLYNLLTRTVLQCGIHANQLHQLIPQSRHELESPSHHDNSHSNPEKDNGENSVRYTDDFLVNERRITTKSEKPTIPDVLSPQPLTENLVAIETVAKASDRLALLGGVPGLISRMRRDNATPDVKTFTMLVDCIESNDESEGNLLVAMETCGVKPDTPFCNLLMRKRVFRQDIDGAKNILELMGAHQLEPDLHTYATLALTCSNKDQAEELLRDIEARDVAPTTEIFSHLNRAAHMNFNYRHWLCEQMERRQLLPDELFIRQCENKILDAKKMIDNWDRLNKDSQRERNFKNKFRLFNQFYQKWIRRTPLKRVPKEPQTFDELSSRNGMR